MARKTQYSHYFRHYPSLFLPLSSNSFAPNFLNAKFFMVTVNSLAFQPQWEYFHIDHNGPTSFGEHFHPSETNNFYMLHTIFFMYWTSLFATNRLRTMLQCHIRKFYNLSHIKNYDWTIPQQAFIKNKTQFKFQFDSKWKFEPTHSKLNLISNKNHLYLWLLLGCLDSKMINKC